MAGEVEVGIDDSAILPVRGERADRTVQKVLFVEQLTLRTQLDVLWVELLVRYLEGTISICQL